MIIEEFLSRYVLKRLRIIMPDPHASLLWSMLVGNSTVLPSELTRQLKVIGIQHIVSASGYNVSLLTRLTQPLWHGFAGIYRLLIWSALAWSYASIANWSPSIIRATIMASLRWSLLWLWGRPSHPLVLLGWTVALMAILDLEMVASVSCQLSVAATAGIILSAPWINHQQSNLVAWEEGLALDTPVITGRKPDTKKFKSMLEQILNNLWQLLLSYTRESLALTVAASLFTLPISVYYFGQVTGLVLLSNLVVAWTIPILSVGAVGLVGWVGVIEIFPRVITQTGTPILVGLLWFPAEWFLRSSQWLSHWTGFSWQLKLDSYYVVLVWELVVASTLILAQWQRRRQVWRGLRALSFYG